MVEENLVDSKKEMLLGSAQRTFKMEAEAIQRLSSQVGDSFFNTVELFHSVKSHVVISGMGKSGLIGKKIASTLASTGTPSFFLHPGEAIHGDLGMLTKNDVILAISGSGETEEMLRLVPIIKRLGIPLVALVCSTDSTLGREADLVLDASVESEACPLKLAPTTSTTATLAMGDAIAVALMELKHFTPMDFAFRHPGGSLGRKLLTRVKDAMESDNLPIVEEETGIKDVISAISNGMKGIAIVEKGGAIDGVVTDGDICRAFEKYNGNFINLKAKDVMSGKPKVVCQDEMIVEAEKLMHESGIVSLLVEEKKDSGVLVGIVQRYDM
ncbi:KpsF/GutQ family sugar-phosphate isomerase [Desulfoluna spongiiphila]|uniref:KpsF/GutQ family sugar-phosphate isomerase n=1 Tax=Desulfoluna spongiiphila TaxID=419481 RepID=UPI001257EB0D|nr:KpsF/GutQ family sugar-phosphate isomerase [Desulfoluna spongiiphila]VVS92367.1 phosphosugar isomerase kdsd/kpsf-type [Desulfoluna spongiiphila]